MLRAIGLLGLALLSTIRPAAAEAPEKLTLAFTFSAPGGFTNFNAAIHHGFWQAQGLDVTWLTPGSAADTMKLLAGGQAQFAIVNSTDITLGRGRGLPLMSVAANNQFGTAGIMVPIEQHVTSLKQIEGKTIGITSIPANRLMLMQVLKHEGIDLTKTRIIDVAFGGMPMLLAGKVDVLGDAITFGEPIMLNKALGKPLSDTSTYS